MTDPMGSKELLSYGEERWDRKRIRADISLAAKWAQKHNVRLTCNQFGSHRAGPAPQDRLNYLRDVREVLEEFGIGWTVWGESAGIYQIEKNHSLDEPAAEALGLLAK